MNIFLLTILTIIAGFFLALVALIYFPWIFVLLALWVLILWVDRQPTSRRRR